MLRWRAGSRARPGWVGVSCVDRAHQASYGGGGDRDGGSEGTASPPPRGPAPKGALQDLGPEPVTLRVTLSYFVEPNPGRRGWRDRYRYASHGLRFAVKGPTESVDEFRKRLNWQALAEEERRPTTGGDPSDWFLGEQARNKGSLHSDLLTDFAANLADRGVVGVYPVSGWWKDQKGRDRSEQGPPYALIVSIETAAVDVDIWTPVALQVGVPVEVVV